MTKRDFFKKVAEMASNDKEMCEMALAELALLDKKNAKAKEKRMEAQASNAPIKATIVDYLTNKSIADVASNIALMCNISTPKAVAMCSQLVDEGILIVSDVSIKGKGKRKCYRLAPQPNPDFVVPDED